MAKEVMYNNVKYDILGAISLNGNDYMILSNIKEIIKLSDFKYIEKANKDNSIRYFYPPKSLKVEDNINADLNNLLTHNIVSDVLKVVKKNIDEDIFLSEADIIAYLKKVKSFMYTDMTFKSFISKGNSLTTDNFNKVKNDVCTYINSQFKYEKVDNIKEDNDYANRPIITKSGLSYDWLYTLDSDTLKELAGDKNRTSEELIYILDALDNRTKTDKALENYSNNQKVKVKKPDRGAAFVDAILLCFIIGSFFALYILSLF